MGQVLLHGPNAAEKLEALVPAALSTLPEGKARYTFFTNETGGIMDDLIVSNAGDHLFLVVNASMRAQDIPHMKAHLKDIEVTEIFDRSLIAVQGPSAQDVVAGHCPQAAELNFMQTCEALIDGTLCRISRLGYTGEDGYEISIPEADAERITRLMLDHPDCAPAGLGARDSLRLEAGLCLYGNDITPDTSPIEAGLNWAIQKAAPRRRRLSRCGAYHGRVGTWRGAQIGRHHAAGPRPSPRRGRNSRPARQRHWRDHFRWFRPNRPRSGCYGLCKGRSQRAGPRAAPDHSRQAAAGHGLRSAIRSTKLQTLNGRPK